VRIVAGADHVVRLLRIASSRRGGVRVMDDQLNVPLEDYELLSEVELTTNLIIAASESDRALPQDEVDRLLGLVGLESRQPIPTQQIRNV
jgi:hypothetical protein